MSKNPKNKPGIHLYPTQVIRELKHKTVVRKEFGWRIIASNGRIIARSSKTYSRKAAAVKSIKTAGKIFNDSIAAAGLMRKYYDHSKPDSPLISYA